MAFLQRQMNRGSVSTGYDIDNSVKLHAAGVNSEFFNRTFSSASNRQTWTFSTWCKRTTLGSNNYLLDAYNNSNTFFILGFSDVDDIVMYDIASGTDYGKRTTAVYRDPSAWYHIVFVSDTTNGTAGDRQRLYVNGVRVTDFDTDYGDPPQNYDGSVNDDIQHRIGSRTDGDSYFSGYLAETCLVDGTALDPDSFGKFDSDSGIWIPIDITGLSVGTNGVLMKYENAASMGAASSGTAFSVQNINQNDQATDTPTNNFATFNPLHYYSNVYTSPSQGATQVEISSAAWKSFVSTIAVSSGKWYVEFEAGTATTFCGVSDVSEVTGVQQNQNYIGNWDKSIGFYGIAGLLFIDGATSTWSGLSYGDGDKIGIALDKDNGYVYMAKNGTWANSGDPTSGSSGTGGVALTTGNSSYQASDQYLIGLSMQPANATAYANYGGFTTMSISSAATDANGYGTFEYAPPSGYYALCGKNLAEFGGEA